jgi:hypothetical protein
MAREGKVTGAVHASVGQEGIAVGVWPISYRPTRSRRPTAVTVTASPRGRARAPISYSRPLEDRVRVTVDHIIDAALKLVRA